jgi:hypothetical protein
MKLEQLNTTQSGSIRKSDAMNWMKNLGEPDQEKIVSKVQPKSKDHSGSTFPKSISNIRVTGDPEFITEFAKLLKPLLVWESSATRIELNLKQIKDRETEELTGNYALYFSVASRGREGAMSNALLGSNKENDQKLEKILKKENRP